MMVFPSERGETPGGSDVTVSGHKQQNWKVQTGLQLWPGTVQCYRLITTMSSPTIIWPLHDLSHHHLSPTEQMTCLTLLVTTCLGMRRDIWDYSSPGWGWPGLVLMFTVQAMTFLSAVRAKAKQPSAICPSRMEHNSGTETSASNDNHTDRYINARESPTLWQLCTILKNVAVEGRSSSQLTFTWMPTLHLHDNKSV